MIKQWSESKALNRCSWSSKKRINNKRRRAQRRCGSGGLRAAALCRAFSRDGWTRSAGLCFYSPLLNLHGNPTVLNVLDHLYTDLYISYNFKYCLFTLLKPRSENNKIIMSLMILRIIWTFWVQRILFLNMRTGFGKAKFLKKDNR